jgi:hypothetical protein
MRYLVVGSDGPGFSSPEEAVEALEKVVLPTFDALIELEAQNRIVAGGLPVADRAFVFILEAPSHAEVDELLRELPAWGALEWEVTPLQSFDGRARIERVALKKLKSGK